MYLFAAKRSYAHRVSIFACATHGLASNLDMVGNGGQASGDADISPDDFCRSFYTKVDRPVGDKGKVTSWHCLLCKKILNVASVSRLGVSSQASLALLSGWQTPQMRTRIA